MANPNVILGRIDRIEPLAEAASEEEKIDREGIVYFEDGKRALLNPADPRSEAYAKVLSDLRAKRNPVYVEVDAAGAIDRLLLPISAKVRNITPIESGEVEVELEVSHTVHVLKPEIPLFEDMLRALTRARDEGAGVLVTETRDDHVIIDVREIPAPFARVYRSEESRDNPALDFASLRAVEPDRARELFDIINTKSCGAFGGPASCIPFLYPDNGCWGRAHAMSFAIRNEGEESGKVWSDYGQRRDVATRNNPLCKVPWAWHVAPVLKVTMGGTPQPWVIDPSLFREPVHLNTWLAVQGGSSGITLFWTAAWVFYRDSVITAHGGPDDIEEVLRASRINLLLRSVSLVGPPPYSHCP